MVKQSNGKTCTRAQLPIPMTSVLSKVEHIFLNKFISLILGILGILLRWMDGWIHLLECEGLVTFYERLKSYRSRALMSILK